MNVLDMGGGDLYPFLFIVMGSSLGTLIGVKLMK
jgi:hypothetical protein